MEFIKSYIDETRLVSHHINTFNDFIVNGIQTIIDREPAIVNLDESISIKFGHVWVDTPKFVHTDRSVCDLFPNQSRKQNSTYEGIIYCNITISIDSKKTIYSRVQIGKLPIMVRSNKCNLQKVASVNEHEECSNDPGGYFIIKGKERVLVGQMRLAYNKVYTFQCKPDAKHVYFAEIRSINNSGNSKLIMAFIDKYGVCYISLPYIKSLLPAGIVYRALEITKEYLLQMFSFADDYTKNNLIEQYNLHQTYEEAIAFIVDALPEDKKVGGIEDATEFVKLILKNEIFYHIGSLTNEKCAIHLSYLLKKLIKVWDGSNNVDDKYNLANKRLDSSGNLVAYLFNGLFKQFTKTLSNQLKNINRCGNPIVIIRNINSLNTLAACFMTSKWTTQKASSVYQREGVSQVLSVQNYGSRISHMRRIMLPDGVKGKNTTARNLHASCINFLCPFETPEGDRVGLINNLANTTDVTIDIPSHEVIVVVEQMLNFNSDPFEFNTTILLNGCIIGSCCDPYIFVKEFETFRKSDLIDNFVSCSHIYYDNEIQILSDEGRLFRPLLEPPFNENNVVFRDVLELEQSVVAMDESDLKRNKCDYMEICPAGTMMSITASVIPFANHTQSPRNSYQASMGKHAIGVPCESFLYRYDTTMHVLNYGQHPITQSKMVNIIKFNEMCHGSMPIVAIMTRCGFNQEDSIILNKASIDRGLFVATTYSTIVEEEKKRGKSDFESFCFPKVQYRRADINYSHLDESGIVKFDKSIFLKAGDAIIGKTTNRKITQPDGVQSLETVDSTIVIKPGKEGFVDSVLVVVNGDGIKTVKIRMRKQRIPEIGDKFASSTAQKGICGMIYSQEDLPFDKDGIAPDLIMNPHAIPSRMTINMLIEQCFNLVGCKSGIYHDATTFAHPNVEQELEMKLKEVGFTDYCSQLYCGFTGAKFPIKTFMAPAFYQRLKHIVSDKIHSRMAGPLEKLTFQPVAGRSRDGGLRVGNMEVECCLSSGVSRMTKEFMYDLSDKYLLPVCTRCGQIPLSRDECQTCKDKSKIQEKTTPFASKLFFQYLQAMGIKQIIK